MTNSNNITLTWNTDGVPLFKSSKTSIWPFYFIINELPYSQRFKRDNMILAGLWFGPSKPATNLFMQTFREDLKQLFKGVSFTHSNSDLVYVRGIVMCGTCDLVAKAQFLNMKQFNSYYGCPNCKQRGERLDNQHVYLFTNDLQMRTTEKSLKYAKEATEKSKDIFGIKGPTELSKIVFKFIETTSIDVMHCVYIGITKKLEWLWFNSENHEHPSSLTKFLNVINARILSISPPKNVPRFPRSIADFSYWKASELKLFLLITLYHFSLI